MKCSRCGEPLVSRRETHRYTECGLSNVVIQNLEVRHCGACGDLEYVFPKLSQLHRLLALKTAEQTHLLTGEQIRFLRKHLGWSREQFSQCMGVAPETVSRWEHQNQPMGAVADRLLRAFVLRMTPIEEYPPEKFADVGQPGPPDLFRVFSGDGGWTQEVATA